MMRASGFAVTDYGVLGVSALAARAHADRVDVLLISVLVLRSALAVAALRATFQALGACPYLIVGGAPFRFDPDLWREVGADAYGRTASDARSMSTGNARRRFPVKARTPSRRTCRTCARPLHV
ncbi:MAG: hypothetical protein WCJ30_27345, partial [Deltaproteobacteria bacterium]